MNPVCIPVLFAREKKKQHETREVESDYAVQLAQFCILQTTALPSTISVGEFFDRMCVCVCVVRCYM